MLVHPAVLGEIAMGSLHRRDVVLRAMADLPRAGVASDEEVMGFVERYRLFGQGIGWTDAHLLAATRLSADALLWTRDRRLRAAARRLGLAAPLD